MLRNGKSLLHGESANTGRFDWVDGPLVNVVKLGSWLLLNNWNLCSPAVVDPVSAANNMSWLTVLLLCSSVRWQVTSGPCPYPWRAISGSEHSKSSTF